MFADFIAGWMAGGVSIIVGHPLDTIKTRLQTMNAYAGFTDCLAKIVKNESMFGLYKGMFLPFMTAGALHSLLFATYATTLRFLNPERWRTSKQETLPLKEIVLATYVSAVVQLIPGIPIELVKTKLQVQCDSKLFNWRTSKVLQSDKVSHRPRDLIVTVYKKHGIRGLYKGGFPMFLRDTLGIGFYLPMYETSKFYLTKSGCNETLSEILAGGTAGSLSWMCICPFEVIKNLSQTRQEASNGKLMLTAKKIFESDGIAGFYKGCITLLTRGFIVNAILFVVYEKTLQFFEK